MNFPDAIDRINLPPALLYILHFLSAPLRFLIWSTDTTRAQGEIVSTDSLLVESTTSGQVSVGNPLLQIVDGNVQARDASCSLLPHSYQNAQGMVSSTLTPQMSSLNISSAAFSQERDQSWVGDVEEAYISGLQENRGESGSDYEVNTWYIESQHIFIL